MSSAIATNCDLCNCENLKWADLNYTPLHYSVRTNNVILTESLLKDPSTDVNARSLDGETPLFLSLRHKVDEEIITSLIESKCDVQIPNSTGIAPLNLAVTRQSPEIAHLLIRNGADVDAKDSQGCTALHEAVNTSCYIAVCMLLYYNASVNEQDSYDGVTPFMLSMESSDKNIQKVLYDYVTDFVTVDYEGRSLIFLATCVGSPLRNNILYQCGGGINFLEDISACLRLLIHEDGHEMKIAVQSSEFFRHVILNCDHANLLQNPYLISKLFENSCFTPAEYVEYLFILLSTEHAVRTVKERSHILYELHLRSVQVVSADDWLGFAYLVFSMGKPLHYFDFYIFYKFFGFGREFEAILRMKPPIQRHILNKYIRGIMAHNIFFSCVRTESIIYHLPLTYSTSILLYHIPFTCDHLPFTNDIFNQYSAHCRGELLDHLRYYTLSSRLRQKLIRKCDDEPQVDLKFVKALNGRCVASLLELCRNKIRKVIVKNNRDKKGIYKTFDDINCLPVPELLKDILHLKISLYL